jgi:hypothetical protein
MKESFSSEPIFFKREVPVIFDGNRASSHSNYKNADASDDFFSLKRLGIEKNKLVLLQDNKQEEKKAISLSNDVTQKLKQYFSSDNFLGQGSILELSGEANIQMLKAYEELNENIDRKLKAFSNYKKQLEESGLDIDSSKPKKHKKENIKADEAQKQNILNDALLLYKKNSRIKYSYQYKNSKQEELKDANLARSRAINSNILSVISNPVNNLLAIDKLSRYKGDTALLNSKEQIDIGKSKIAKDRNSYKSKHNIFLPTSIAKDNKRVKNDMLVASTIKQNIKNMLQFTTGVYNYQVPKFFDFSA